LGVRLSYAITTQIIDFFDGLRFHFSGLGLKFLLKAIVFGDQISLESTPMLAYTYVYAKGEITSRFRSSQSSPLHE
jgi:hypothetical protein